MEHTVTLVDGPRDGETTAWPVGDEGQFADSIDHHVEITWAEHPDDPPSGLGLPELGPDDPVVVVPGRYVLDGDGETARWVEDMPLAG